MNSYPFRVGLFGVGLDTYWDQFEGLESRLQGYLDRVEDKLRRPNVEVVNAGLVDTPDKAFDAAHRFRREDVRMVFLYVTTYALSSTVLPVVRRLGAPVVVLNLAPVEAIDYAQFNSLPGRTRMTGEWLAHCASCPVPEFANVFKRSGIEFHQVTGTLEDDPECWDEVDDWLESARVAHAMEHNRCGLLGHYYCGMLDIYTDLTRQSAAFGGHFEIIEVDELSAIRTKLEDAAVEERVAAFNDAFDIRDDVDPKELRRAAATSAALDQLVERHRLGSMAYYYEGTGNPANVDTMSSVILGNSLLTARGVPVAGEYEVKNVQAMKIMDCFGAGGSFTEYYAMDFRDDVVLMGHDGPGHIAIAEGKTRVRPLEVYHGKVGLGVSVEMSVKHGPVTLLSVVEEAEGGVAMLVAEGESVPGPILEIGNTNSRYRFSIGARRFVNEWNLQGPAHHCAVGVGHIAHKIDKLAQVLGLRVVRVC